MNNSITPSEIVLIHGDKFASRKRFSHIVVTMIITIPFLLINVYSNWPNIQKSFLSENWPMVVGKIQSSQLIRNIGGDTTYRAEISYIYFINGKKFQNNVVRFDEEINPEDVKKYTTGMQVHISYLSYDPQIAVLEPGLHSQYFLGFFFWLLYFVLVFFLVKKIRLTPTLLLDGKSPVNCLTEQKNLYLFGQFHFNFVEQYGLL